MLRLGHISDLHLMERVRFDDSRGALGRTLTSFKGHEVDIIIISGDLSGRDAPHHTTVDERQALAFFFRQCSTIAPTVIIRGNHDRKSEILLYRECASKHTIYAVDQCEAIAGRSGIMPCVAIFALPWAPLRSYRHDIGHLPTEEANELVLQHIAARYKEFTHGLTSDCIRVVISHYPVLGATCGSFEIKSGRDVTLNQQWLNDLQADYIALGHIHKQQQVADRTWYAGSPYPVDFSETYQHGWNLVEIENGNTHVTMIPIEAWNMVTLHGEWNQSGCVMHPLMNPLTMQPYPKDIFDNAHVRLQLTIPQFRMLDSLPLDDIQIIIMKNGGYLEKKDIHVTRRPQSLDTPQLVQASWTLTQRLENTISQRINDPNIKRRLLERLSELG